jgi:peptidoglycan hydrolase CwlO-like protein
MKKLIILFIMFFAITANAQISYPRYEKDSLGQTVVLLTVEQAQALDNSTDLLALFRKLDAQLVDYDSICLKVVAEKDIVIAEQTVQINKLKETLQVKNDEIDNLQKRLLEKDKKIVNLETEIKNKDREIDLHLGEIGRVKRNAWIGGSLGGLSIVGLIIAIIAIN